MAQLIKLADPCLYPECLEAMATVVASGNLVNGQVGHDFGADLATLTGRRHAIPVSSGTTALLAALVALKIGPGSRVVVPALTFPAPAAAARFLGAEVIVCDVDPETFCICAKTLEPHLQRDLAAVIAVDQFGLPAPAPELSTQLSSRGIPLLVDAACSIGSTLDGKPCGSFGKAAIFSFHPRKVVSTGEGGAVLTDDDELATRVRHIVNHGLEPSGFACVGLNFRLGEIAAAIGRVQLRHLSELVARRVALFQFYRALPLGFQKVPPAAMVNHQTAMAVLPPTSDRAKRDEFILYLKDRAVEATIGSYCLGAVPALAKGLGITAADTPVAQDVADRSIALPLHGRMTDDDAIAVASAVRSWFEREGTK